MRRSAFLEETQFFKTFYFGLLRFAMDRGEPALHAAQGTVAELAMADFLQDTAPFHFAREIIEQCARGFAFPFSCFNCHADKYIGKIGLRQLLT